MSSTVGWMVLVGALGAFGPVACGGKKEPTPSERVAQVIEKGPSNTKPGTATAPPAKPAEPIAKDPAPPVETTPKTAPSEPVKPIEPPPEPPPSEPVKPVEPPPEPPPSEPVKPVEPPPEPPPTEPGPTGQAMFDIGVNDAAMTLAIDNRFPSERKTSFTIGVDPKVYAWLDFKNAGDQAQLFFVWKKEGKETWRIAINVGKSKNWRTWAEKKIGKKDAGAWSVDVVDEAGHVYQTLSYDVVAGP